ncbi:MAG: hypothetical protein ABIJ46_00505 [bacterium]
MAEQTEKGLFSENKKPTDIFEGKFTRQQLQEMGSKKAAVAIMEETARLGTVGAVLADVFPDLSEKEIKDIANYGSGVFTGAIEEEK